MLHILELIAGIFGIVVGVSRLPDAVSALQILTPTAVGLGGLRRLLLSALPATAFSLSMIYLAIRALIEADLSLL